MIYDILDRVINKNKTSTVSANKKVSDFDKLLAIQDERISALREELNQKNDEIKFLKTENQKLLGTSAPQQTQTEKEKPLTAQEIYRKFQSGKGSEIISKLETEFKK